MNPILQLLLSAGTMPGETALKAVLEYDLKRRDQMDPDLRKRSDLVRVQMEENFLKITNQIWKLAGIEL
jgi:hypothetical protein